MLDSDPKLKETTSPGVCKVQARSQLSFNLATTAVATRSIQFRNGSDDICRFCQMPLRKCLFRSSADGHGENVVLVQARGAERAEHVCVHIISFDSDFSFEKAPFG